MKKNEENEKKILFPVLISNDATNIRSIVWVFVFYFFYSYQLIATQRIYIFD